MTTSCWKSELVLNKQNVPITFDSTNAKQVFVRIAAAGDIITATAIADKFEAEASSVALLALIRACQGAHITFAQWVSEKFREQLTDKIVWESRVLYATCKYGDLELLQWVVNFFHMSEIQSKLELDCGSNQGSYEGSCLTKFVREGIEKLCESNDLVRIQYILDALPSFEFNAAEALWGAIDKCAYESAVYLVNKYNITREDLIDFEYRFIAYLAQCKNIALLEWAISCFAITFTDMRENTMLGDALYHGNYEVAQWLAGNFPFTWEDLRCDVYLYRHYSYHQNSISHACENNRLDIANWIVTRFGVTNEIFRKLYVDSESSVDPTVQNAIDNSIYQSIFKICANGHLDAVKWFVKQFDIKQLTYEFANEIGFDFRSMVAYACANGHVGTINWLVDNYVEEEWGRRQSIITTYLPLESCIVNIQLLESVCKNGHLALLKYEYELVKPVKIMVYHGVQVMLKLCKKKGYMGSGQDIVNFAKLTMEEIADFPHLLPAAD